METKEYQDGFSGIGTVTVRPFKIGPDGTRHYMPFTKNNLIVEMGRAGLIDLITGTQRKHLAYIRWGKGGALKFPDGDPLNPIPVNDKDTDVKTFLIDKQLSPFKRISPTEVEYVETLICDEIDDDVNEAAMLFEVYGTLARTIFARITFPTVRLTVAQGTGIEIRWVFSFKKAEEVLIDYEETPIETPPNDLTPPANVTNLAETHNSSSVSLTWTSPPDGDFAYVRIYRDGVLIADEIYASSWADTGLKAATAYTYTVTSVDRNGNESEGTMLAANTSA